jgi:hypothetical protein
MGPTWVSRIPSWCRERTCDNLGRPDSGRPRTGLALVDFNCLVAFLKRLIDVRYSFVAVSGVLRWGILEFVLGLFKMLHGGVDARMVLGRRICRCRDGRRGGCGGSGGLRRARLGVKNQR